MIKGLDLNKMKVIELKKLVADKDELLVYFNCVEDEDCGDEACDERVMLYPDELIENLESGEGTYENSIFLNDLKKDLENLDDDDICINDYFSASSRVALFEDNE